MRKVHTNSNDEILSIIEKYSNWKMTLPQPVPNVIKSVSDWSSFFSWIREEEDKSRKSNRRFLRR
jgi:hypothetical protein